MNVAVCFNRVPPKLFKGEATDRISEEGAEAEARAVKKTLTELGHSARLLPLGGDIVPFIEELRAKGCDAVIEGLAGGQELRGVAHGLILACGAGLSRLKTIGGFERTSGTPLIRRFAR